jgi:hypothetical protein
LLEAQTFAEWGVDYFQERKLRGAETRRIAKRGSQAGYGFEGLWWGSETLGSALSSSDDPGFDLRV